MLVKEVNPKSSADAIDNKKKEKNMKTSKGFTLVELVIVIVIVGILSIVAVPIYRGYTRKAMASEGKALVGSVQTSQKIYFAEYGNFYDGVNMLATSDYDATVDVDARANKYFKTYAITTNNVAGDGANFTASTTADTASGATGITISLTGAATGIVTTDESGI